MANRIKELINEVGTDVSGKWINIDNVELLAKKIADECCQIVEDTNGVPWDDILHIKENIQNVFGLENERTS